jgi:hypothetical protein
VELTLHYRGPLRASGSGRRRVNHKHALREHFHKQLKRLWDQPPLLDEHDTSFAIRKRGHFRFVPLVDSKSYLIAELQITMLRPGPPGSIVTQTGDIDNRLKTLLDALKMPEGLNDLPSDAAPSSDEDPFYCLLEDDRLITNIDIQTAQLLEPDQDEAEVVLLIRVVTKATQVTIGNLSIG